MPFCAFVSLLSQMRRSSIAAKTTLFCDIHFLLFFVHFLTIFEGLYFEDSDIVIHQKLLSLIILGNLQYNSIGQVFEDRIIGNEGKLRIPYTLGHRIVSKLSMRIMKFYMEQPNCSRRIKDSFFIQAKLNEGYMKISVGWFRRCDPIDGWFILNISIFFKLGLEKLSSWVQMVPMALDNWALALKEVLKPPFRG